MVETIVAAATAWVLWIGTLGRGGPWDWDPNQSFDSRAECYAQKQKEIDSWEREANLSQKEIDEGLRSKNDMVMVSGDEVYLVGETRIMYRYHCLPVPIDPREQKQR